MQNTISVVIPSYNSEKYIERCIESVLVQKVSEVIEIIVIDGASTDGTIECLRKYENVKCLSEPDSGQSDGFNKGINLARGEWIILLDSDDELTPGSIALYLASVQRDDSLDVVYGHTQFIDGESNHIRNVISVPFRYENLIYDLAIPPSSGLFYKAAVLKKNPMSVNHHYNMDTEWFLRCGENLKFKLVNDYTILFRFWGSNKTALLFDKGTVPPEIIEERLVLKRNFTEPYLRSIENQYLKRWFRARARAIYCLNKVFHSIFLVGRKRT